MTKEDALQSEAAAENLLRRATNLLDLSEIPEAYRGDSSTQAALQLKEVIDRTLLPVLVSVPDLAMVEAAVALREATFVSTVELASGEKPCPPYSFGMRAPM